MQPFDPIALVAMLLTFYPIVSMTALRRARQERPEYFGAGVLFGTVGEKLALPDGRVFDLIFDADGPQRRWQAIDVTAGGETERTPWPLEPGPLTPLDPEATLPLPMPTHFEPIVWFHMGDVDGAERGIEGAGSTVAGRMSSEAFDAAYEDTAGRAARALDQELAAIDGLNPSDKARNTEGLERRAEDTIQEYPNPEETAPPPEESGPEKPMPRTGPGGRWKDQDRFDI